MTAVTPFLPSFLLFQQEGHLIQSTLTAGLTAALTADVHHKGQAYVAMFNLATGLERLFKAVIIAEHMFRHASVAPTVEQLRVYRHSLRNLYDACKEIGGQPASL